MPQPRKPAAVSRGTCAKPKPRPALPGLCSDRPLLNDVGCDWETQASLGRGRIQGICSMNPCLLLSLLAVSRSFCPHRLSAVIPPGSRSALLSWTRSIEWFSTLISRRLALFLAISITCTHAWCVASTSKVVASIHRHIRCTARRPSRLYEPHGRLHVLPARRIRGGRLITQRYPEHARAALLAQMVEKLDTVPVYSRGGWLGLHARADWPEQHQEHGLCERGSPVAGAHSTDPRLFPATEQ